MLSSLLFTVFVAEGETRGKFGHLLSQTGSRCLFLKPQASWEGRRGRTFWSCMSRLVTILTEPGLFRGERLEGIICRMLWHHQHRGGFHHLIYNQSYLNTDDGDSLLMGTCKALVPYQWSRRKIVCKLVHH